MDWFRYDNGLRHERVKQFLKLKGIKKSDSSYIVNRTVLRNYR